MQRLTIGSLLIFICSLIYLGGFLLNMQLFHSMNFSEGVSWIFLPAGLRLLLVLIFGLYGAVGISIASILMGWQNFFADDHLTAILSGLISGFSPFVARSLILNKTRLSDSLNNLGPKSLLICIFIFAVISPFFHQILFYINGYTNNFGASLAVMIVGDLIGSLIVVYAAKLTIEVNRLLLNKSSRST